MDADDWVSITEDLPQVAKGVKSVSVDVLAMVDGSKPIREFYCYIDGEWYAENGKRVKGDVAAWQSESFVRVRIYGNLHAVRDIW